jgi:excisionase family DNA binding protein
VQKTVLTENQDSVPTIDELSAYLKISRTTPYKLPRKELIPAQKIGKKPAVQQRHY